MNHPGLGNITIPYIFVQLANGFSITWDNNERKRRGPNYFVRLTHKRVATSYGDNQVGTGTLQINYVPLPDEDPDFIEKQLIDAGGVMYFRYGHDESHSGKSFKAITKNYSVTVNGGVISLNIEIVSCAVAFVKYQACFVWDQLTAEDLGSVRSKPKELWAPTDSDIIEAYNIPITRDGMVKGIRAYINKTMSGEYEFDEAGSDIAGATTTEIRIVGKNVIEGLEEFTRYMANDDENSYYAVVIDDAVSTPGSGETKKKIRIKKITGALNDGNTEGIKSYTYNYNSKDCDIISFSTSYRGDAAIYKNTQLTGNFFYNVLLEEDEDGNFYEKPQREWAPSKPSTLTTNSAAITNQKSEDLNYWRSHFQIAIYNATVQVLGVSTDENINIGTLVQINIFVGNRPHHTSGVYQVIEITDDISSSGFFTTYGLIKASQTDTDEYYEKYKSYVNTEV